MECDLELSSMGAGGGWYAADELMAWCGEARDVGSLTGLALYLTKNDISLWEDHPRAFRVRGDADGSR